MRIFALTCVLLALLSVYSVDQVDPPKLVYVQQVFRHGARYPIYPSTLDNSIYAKQENRVGQLTKQGMSMHYLLGQELYKQYWSKLFGGLNYYNQSKFYFKSTNVNRTIESIQSQLLGIFQNTKDLQLVTEELLYSKPNWPGLKAKVGPVFGASNKFHPLPVHVQKGYMSPWDRGDFLRLYGEDFCYKQKDWMEENKINRTALDMLNNPKVTAALAQLQKQLKSNISFWDAYRYLDNAVCMEYANKPVLPIFKSDSTHKPALQFMKIFDLVLKFFYNEKQLSAISTAFFNQTAYDFRRIQKSTQGVQWVMYSAHDTTVVNFLTRLNLTNVGCLYQQFQKGVRQDSKSERCVVEFPNFASSLIFQVYKSDSGSHTMKVRYNGAYRLIPFCGWKQECPLSDFYMWFDSWKDENYETTCGVVDSSKDLARLYFSLMVLLLGIVLCLLVYYVTKSLQSKQTPTKKHEKEPTASNNNIIKESLLSEREE